jgi:hypothetical protein
MMGTAFFGDSGFESSANDEWKGKNNAERQNVSTNRKHSFESGVFIAEQQLSPQSQFSRCFNFCPRDGFRYFPSAFNSSPVLPPCLRTTQLNALP